MQGRFPTLVLKLTIPAILVYILVMLSPSNYKVPSIEKKSPNSRAKAKKRANIAKAFQFDHFSFVLDKTSALPLDNQQREQLCHSLFPCRGAEVAVVGNGPLSDVQRKEINNSSRYETVIRFNHLSNMAATTDKITHWILRGPNANIHGWINNSEAPAVDIIISALQQTKLILAMKVKEKAPGGRINFDGLHHSPIPELHFYPDNKFNGENSLESQMHKAVMGIYNRVHRQSSSGFIGVLAAAGCLLDMGTITNTNRNIGKGVINVYGFNWHHENHGGHTIDIEEAIIKELEMRGMVKVHPPPCYAYRDCEDN